MDVTRHQPREPKPCAAEIRIHGLLYIRIERLPRWLIPAIAAAGEREKHLRLPGSAKSQRSGTSATQMP